MTLYLDPRPKDRLLQFGRELIADGFLQDPPWFERKRKHQHKLIDFGLVWAAVGNDFLSINASLCDTFIELSG